MYFQDEFTNKLLRSWCQSNSSDSSCTCGFQSRWALSPCTWWALALIRTPWPASKVEGENLFSTLEFRQSRFDQVYSDLIVAPEVLLHLHWSELRDQHQKQKNLQACSSYYADHCDVDQGIRWSATRFFSTISQTHISDILLTFSPDKMSNPSG